MRGDVQERVIGGDGASSESANGYDKSNGAR
jgi:hypothetical protein